MMQMMRNQIMLAARMANSDRATTRLGTVTSYDPNNYAVVVKMHPDGIMTGWLPLVSPWSGNGWGMFAPPTIGDLVELQFVDDSLEAGFACQRFFTDQNRPLSVPTGEFWLVHQSGSMFKFHNDGTVELHAQTAINSSAPAWNHTGPVNINGNTTVTGNIVATGDISDHTNKSMLGMRNTYNNHTHTDPQGGSVSTPSASM